MDIYYYDLIVEKEKNIDAVPMSFYEIIHNMDYITLHVPYGKKTTI